MRALTNTVCNSDNYILKCGQIHLAIWIFPLWGCLISASAKYIWKVSSNFIQTHFYSGGASVHWLYSPLIAKEGSKEEFNKISPRIPDTLSRFSTHRLVWAIMVLLREISLLPGFKKHAFFYL